MSVLAVVCFATTVILFISAVFLGTELLKKMKFFSDFLKDSGDIKLMTYSWEGAKKAHKKSGMYKFLITAPAPFEVIIGFELSIDLLNFRADDYYGFVQSNYITEGLNQVCFETYLGKGSADFVFKCKSIEPQTYELKLVDRNDPHGVVTVSYPPHWWQKLGF